MGHWLVIVFGTAAIILLLHVLYFAYVYHPFNRAIDCNSIPSNSIVLALGFVYTQKESRPDTDDKLDPGEANRFLAAELLRCLDRISLVYTQKAISDALEAQGSLLNGRLRGGAPVLQMHAHHPDHPVRTLQALQLALTQMEPLPVSLVLLAHDKQIERAQLDLAALYSGKIYVWPVRKVPYQDEKWFRPLSWAVRELYFARPIEAVQRWRMKQGD